MNRQFDFDIVRGYGETEYRASVSDPRDVLALVNQFMIVADGIEVAPIMNGWMVTVKKTSAPSIPNPLEEHVRRFGDITEVCGV